jgi:DNA-directed RNA polymerase subunit RPC12/RpoP
MKKWQITCVRCGKVIPREELKLGFCVQEDTTVHAYEVCPYCEKWGCARVTQIEVTNIDEKTVPYLV